MAALVPATHRVERAAAEFRRGMPILLGGANPGQSGLALASETASDALLAGLAGLFSHAPVMLLSHARARTLKIPLYTPGVIAIRLEKDVRPARLHAVADPATDLDHPLKGPFDPLREALPESAHAAVKLAKLGGLLPSAVYYALSDGDYAALAADGVLLAASAAAILAYEAEALRTLGIVTRARLPLRDAEDTELIAFRPADGGPEHYALVIGHPGEGGAPALTRLHSECFTGDLLGSLRCDCGDQLRGAIAAIAKAGGGVLLYLAQEGRGIGLMNKLRAYRLQDEGFDTMEANERLGFEADERFYAIAARMLNLLGISSVRLMTNNPEKVRALEDAGIAVRERVSHTFPDNVHNRAYLKAKAEKGGHLF
jgi:GTP cyclohydrolase II